MRRLPLRISLMLKRQLWPTHNLNSHSSVCSLHVALYDHRPNFRQRCRHLSTPRAQSNHVPAATDSPPDKRQDLADSQESSRNITWATRKIDRNRTRKSPETWIDPNSLSESLEAHRWANRNGLARDGVPLYPSDRKRHHHPGTKRLLIPQYGVKRLQLANYAANAGTQPKTYEGNCPPLSSEWGLSGSVPYQLRVPWMTHVASSDHTLDLVSSASQLDEEVKACERYFSPTRAEKKAAADAFDQIKSIITPFLKPDDKAILIGSRAAGTDGPISDLDINVRFEANTESERGSNVRKRLQRLFVAMRTEVACRTLLMHAFRGKANVPVIVGTHLPSGLEFQIQSAASSHDTLEVVRAFVAEYPTVRGLFHILRQMLNMRGLNDGRHGGLTSYPLLNMIVVALKLGDPRVEFEDSGAQLLHFLDFWSSINFDKHRITMVDNEGGIDPISTVPQVVANNLTDAGHSYLMEIDDPADSTNNLGKNITRIKHVQACLITAREKIQSAMRRWDDSAHRIDIREQCSPILAWCLEADYSSYEEARQQLRKYGQQVGLHKSSDM